MELSAVRITVEKTLYVNCKKNIGLSHDSLGTSFYAEHSTEHYTFICRYLVACNGSYMISPMCGLITASSVLVPKLGSAERPRLHH
jgi:hypothetical protein